jgi:AcrR family transcriptional regulator
VALLSRWRQSPNQNPATAVNDPGAPKPGAPRGGGLGRGGAAPATRLPRPAARRRTENRQRERLCRSLVELSQERGYAGVTMRALCAQARVSSRTFYELYDSKEELFLEIHGRLAGLVLEAARKALGGPGSLKRRLRSLLERLFELAGGDPGAARACLIDPYAVGARALARLDELEGSLVALVSAAIAEQGQAVGLSGLLGSALVGGICYPVLERTLSNRTGELPALVEPLVGWACACADPALGRLAPLLSERRLAALRTAPRWPAGGRGERDRLCCAAVAIVGERGYPALEERELCKRAGVDRSTFRFYFSTAEECLLGASEPLALAAMLSLRQSLRSAPAGLGGFYRATLELSAQLAQAPQVARVACLELDRAGPRAAEAKVGLLAPIAALLSELLGSYGPLPGVAAEATVGACYALVRSYVVSDRLGELASLTPLLAYLALAPSIGAARAVAAIEAEQRAVLGDSS